MGCPLCGSDAYVGLLVVECSRPKCFHYKPPEVKPGQTVKLVPDGWKAEAARAWHEGFRTTKSTEKWAQVARYEGRPWCAFRDCGLNTAQPSSGEFKSLPAAMLCALGLDVQEYQGLYEINSPTGPVYMGPEHYLSTLVDHFTKLYNP